jgi:hypothetical protein
MYSSNGLLNKTFLVAGVFAIIAWCATFSTASAANPRAILSIPKITLTSGSGTSTLVNLTENPDGTLSLEALQDGNLNHFGHFTGTFNYLANIDENSGTTLLTGTGEFDFSPTDKIKLSLFIVEVGADYPRPYSGILTVIGGTGKFARARGELEIRGIDEESFTDGFKLDGLIITQ